MHIVCACVCARARACVCMRVYACVHGICTNTDIFRISNNLTCIHTMIITYVEKVIHYKITHTHLRLVSLAVRKAPR